MTWPLFVVIAGLLALGAVGMHLLGGARSYVAGESIWSKAQKEASIQLDRFAEDGDERKYALYEAAIEITLADHRARLALDERRANVALARSAFAQARNHPADIDAMIDLYRYAGWYPAFARAIEVWREADREVARMRSLAAQMRDAKRSGQNQSAVMRLRAQLREIDDILTPLEHRFSDEVGLAERELRVIISACGSLVAVMLAIWAAVISRRMLRRLSRLAQFDSLTGLPNRSHLEETLRSALLRARLERRAVAVLYLDLDGFKAINDTLGHTAGDEVLVEMGRRLRKALSEGDTVARLGGDEFAIVVENSVTGDAIEAVGRSVRDMCVQPVLLRHREIFVTASVGVAMFPEDGMDGDTLLMHADIAMYRAKHETRNQLCFYAPEMSDAVNERFSLQAQLRRAIENGEFELYYQPVINLCDDRVVSMEALLRWHHPQWGLTLPDRFMAVAEQTGLIVQIGEWVMQQACRQARLWNDGLRFPVSVALNLSARQFREFDLVNKMHSAILANNIDGALLRVEITETTVMENLEASSVQVRELRAMGINVALDDFGTGHSSMSYLKHFQLDEVKIDRSFIQDITSHENDVAIVKAIVALAHTLKLIVTAEGAETEDQLALVRELGCDRAQGHIIGRPMPVEQATRVLGDALPARIRFLSSPDIAACAITIE